LVLFDILDVDKNGLLTRFEVNYFHRELVKMLKKKIPDHDVTDSEAVMSEIFDMLQSPQEGVCKADFLKCLSATRFVRSLTDLKQFMGTEVGNAAYGPKDDDDDDEEEWED
jgi:hypothetical protein